MPTNPLNHSDSDTAPLGFLHYHLNTTSTDSSLTRNEKSRLMNQCTATRMRGWTFSESHCAHHLNLQSVRVICQNPNDAQVEDEMSQSCGPNEVCADTGLTIAEGRAYCVATQNFAPFPYSYRRETKTYTIPYPADAGTISANALVSDSTRRSLQIAETLRLEALKRGTEIARRVIGAESVIGEVDCKRCFSTRMQPLPEGTDDSRAIMTIENPQPGYLFLVTVS